MPDYIVFYLCSKKLEALDSTPVMRAVTETDSINAILAARREERLLTGINCPDCTLAAVRPAQ